MHFQLACFEEARRAYLDQCAYMHQSLNTYAESRGGVGQLSPEDERVYRGRMDGLVKLVAYDDAALAAIAEMKDWIDELIAEKRRILNKLQEYEQPRKPVKAGPILEHLFSPLSQETEDTRAKSIHKAREVWADHY